jgi:hypothetical protein
VVIHAEKVYRTTEKYGPRTSYVVVNIDGQRVVITIPGTKES